MATHKLEAKDLKDICNELSTVTHKLSKIEVQLCIPPHKLEAGDDPLSSVFNYWLCGNAINGPAVTWESIVTVLKSKHVDEVGLAEKIEKKYCGGSSVMEKQKRIPESLEGPNASTIDGASVHTVSAAVPSGSIGNNYTPKLDTKSTEVDTGVFEELSITPDNGTGDSLDNDNPSNEEEHTHDGPCQEDELIVLPQPILHFNENGNAECVVSNKSASGVEQSDDQEKDSNMTTSVQDSGSSLASTVHQQQLNYPSEAGFEKINYFVSKEQKKSKEKDKIIADLHRKLALKEKEHKLDKQKLTKSTADKEKALTEKISKSDELIKKYTHHIKMLQKENKLELEKKEREVQELKKKVEEQDKQLKRAEMEKENLSLRKELEIVKMQKKYDEEIAQLKREIENAEHEKECLSKDLEHQKQKGECDMKVQKAELEKEALREKNEQEKEYLREKNEQEKEYLREKNEQDKEYLREKSKQEKDYLREKNEQDKEYLREKSEEDKEILQQKIKGLEEEVKIARAISSGSNDTPETFRIHMKQTEIAIETNLQKMNISDQDDQLTISD